ncbi:MAG: acetoacetate decarboxylase family protein [Syntrophobacteraceae bacterium]
MSESKLEPVFRMMPHHFGLRDRRGSAFYGDVTTIAITYLTERKLLAQYLPEPFEVGPEPLVSVSYAMNREIEWLAGGCYNIIGVNASAVFKGQVDEIAGSYCLVMWENLTDPILTGRELQGIPKIYADIPDHTISEGVWRTCASYRGHTIVDLSIRDLVALPESGVKDIETMSREGNWMGWKYIPKTGEPGAEVSHATLFPTESSFREAWIGVGEVVWRLLTWEQNPTQFHIVNALEELPILEYRSAVVLKGNTNLIVPERPARALR